MTGRLGPAGNGTAAIAVLAVAVLACVAWSAAAGPSWSWDRAHYHAYAGWQWANDALGRGFLPAGGQTFLNPLGYVPAHLLSRSGWSELAVASATAAFQALAVWAVWLIARDRLDGRAAPLAAAAAAFLTPVFLSQLGTSYLDATTGVGVLLGVWACRRAGDPGRSALAWAALGGLAMGLAAGLKLSNALPAAMAPLLFAFAGGGAGRGRFARLAATTAAFGTAGVAGLAAALGDWGAKLHRGYGNPFYPILDRVFNPPAVPSAGASAALDGAAARTPLETIADVLRASGGRFVPDSLASAASFPWRIADPRVPTNMAYLEWHAPDPRLALLLAALAGVAVATWVRRARGTIGRLDAGSAKPAPHPAPHPTVDGPLLAFVAAWGALWLYSSANGRYGVALLMLASVPLVQAAFALLRAGRVRRYVLGALLALQAWYAIGVAERIDVAPDARWETAALEADVPESLRTRPWLHVPTTPLSWSYLMPRLHPDSAFATLSAACRDDGCPRGLHVSRAAQVLREWAGRVRMLTTVNALEDGSPRVGERLVARYDAEFAEFGLRVDAAACEFLRVRPNLGGAMLVEPTSVGETYRPSEWLASCPLVPATPDSVRRSLETVSRHDALFDAVARACADRLGLERPRTRWLGDRTWIREYGSVDTAIRIAGGDVTLVRMGRDPIAIGSVDALVADGGLRTCGPATRG